MKVKKPRILFVDIETSLKHLVGFGVREQNFQPNQLKKDTTVLAWSARFKGEKKIYSASTRYKRDKRDDKQMLKEMHKLFEKADIVIAHNGDGFDIKQLRTRFIKHGFKPQNRPKSHDTLKISRREFGFTFNKLEYLAIYLGLPLKKLVDRKYQGLTLWEECEKGNQDAWNEMMRYNKRDVEVLEMAWDKISPWAGINHSCYNGGKELCGACGSTEFVNNGVGVSGKSMYQRRRCIHCGNEIKGKKV